MPKEIRRDMERLSLHPAGAGVSERKDRKKSRSYRKEHWVYGYHFKNRHARRIAKKHGLPWQKQPFTTMDTVLYHIRVAAGRAFSVRAVPQRDYLRTSRIITFAEDDGRKRLKYLEATEKEMESVRKVLGIPKGTKPKWYNYHFYVPCDEGESSEDEAYPGNKILVRMEDSDEEDDNSEDGTFDDIEGMFDDCVSDVGCNSIIRSDSDDSGGGDANNKDSNTQ